MKFSWEILILHFFLVGLSEFPCARFKWLIQNWIVRNIIIEIYTGYIISRDRDCISIVTILTRNLS